MLPKQQEFSFGIEESCLSLLKGQKHISAQNTPPPDGGSVFFMAEMERFGCICALRETAQIKVSTSF